MENAGGSGKGSASGVDGAQQRRSSARVTDRSKSRSVSREESRPHSSDSRHSELDSSINSDMFYSYGKERMKKMLLNLNGGAMLVVAELGMPKVVSYEPDSGSDGLKDGRGREWPFPVKFDPEVELVDGYAGENFRVGDTLMANFYHSGAKVSGYEAGVYKVSIVKIFERLATAHVERKKLEEVRIAKLKASEKEKKKVAKTKTSSVGGSEGRRQKELGSVLDIEAERPSLLAKKKVSGGHVAGGSGGVSSAGLAEKSGGRTVGGGRSGGSGNGGGSGGGSGGRSGENSRGSSGGGTVGGEGATSQLISTHLAVQGKNRASVPSGSNAKEDDGNGRGSGGGESPGRVAEGGDGEQSEEDAEVVKVVKPSGIAKRPLGGGGKRKRDEEDLGGGTSNEKRTKKVGLTRIGALMEVHKTIEGLSRGNRKDAGLERLLGDRDDDEDGRPKEYFQWPKYRIPVRYWNKMKDTEAQKQIVPGYDVFIWKTKLGNFQRQNGPLGSNPSVRLYGKELLFHMIGGNAEIILAKLMHKGGTGIETLVGKDALFAVITNLCLEKAVECADEYGILWQDGEHVDGKSTDRASGNWTSSATPMMSSFRWLDPSTFHLRAPHPATRFQTHPHIPNTAHVEQLFKLPENDVKKSIFTQAMNNHMLSLMNSELKDDYPSLSAKQRADLIAYLERYVEADTGGQSDEESDGEDAHYIMVRGRRTRVQKGGIGKRGCQDRIADLLVREWSKKPEVEVDVEEERKKQREQDLEISDPSNFQPGFEGADKDAE